MRQEPIVVRNPRTGEVIYLPPDHQDVEALIDDLIVFVQANRGLLDPLLLAGLCHKQLVVIHPFMDGNGRTTRLATKVLLARLGLDTFNLFSFESYYNQMEKQLERHQATPATALQPHHQAILEYIDEHGFITDKVYAQLTDRAKATRTLDFNRLLELGVIVREGRGRDTYYRRPTHS